MPGDSEGILKKGPSDSLIKGKVHVRDLIIFVITN